MSNQEQFEKWWDGFREPFYLSLEDLAKDAWNAAKASVPAQSVNQELLEALKRLRYNAQHIFDKLPVRDWAETFAEADWAISRAEEQQFLSVCNGECNHPYCWSQKGPRAEEQSESGRDNELKDCLEQILLWIYPWELDRRSETFVEETIRGFNLIGRKHPFEAEEQLRKEV